MLVFLICALVVLIDQLSKFLVSRNVLQGESIPILKNIFHITFLQNRGAAFGLFIRKTPFFVALSLIAIILILTLYKKARGRSPLLQVSLSLILGGALGNLVDRLRFGFVRDFLDFRIWPVFNVADAAISVGAGLLVLQAFLKPRRMRDD